MVEVIHLDSCLLRGLLDPCDQSEHRAEAKHLMNSYPHTRFRISILAVGEVVGKMAEARSAAVCGEAAAELSRLFRGRRLELYGIGVRGEAVDLAALLLKADKLMSPADAVLVACALADDECTTFATTDRTLIQGMVIKTQAAAHGVKILDANKVAQKEGASRIGRVVHKTLQQLTGRGAA